MFVSCLPPGLSGMAIALCVVGSMALVVLVIAALSKCCRTSPPKGSSRTGQKKSGHANLAVISHANENEKHALGPTSGVV